MNKQARREVLRSLGQLLRSLRKRLGHKQSDVADCAGISASDLSRIERGKHMISVETLARLIKVLAPSPGEESQILRQVMNLASVASPGSSSEASITSFEQAYARAKYFMERGDLIGMRAAVRRMEELASSPEEKATYKFSFAIWYKTHWVPDLAHFYLEQALGDLRGSSNDYLRHRVLLALADLYCRRNLETIAEPIADQVIAFDPIHATGYAKGDKIQGQRVHYWARFIKSGAYLRGDRIAEAIKLRRTALYGFRLIEGRDANMVGWIEIHLAEAYAKQTTTRKRAVIMLDNAILKWGVGGERPLDPENLAWALLKKGEALNDEDCLQRARTLADRNGYGEIRDILDAREQAKAAAVAPASAAPVRRNRLSPVASVLLMVVLSLLASQFIFLAAAAAKDLM